MSGDAPLEFLWREVTASSATTGRVASHSLQVCGVRFSVLLSVHLLPGRPRVERLLLAPAAEHTSRASGIQLGTSTTRIQKQYSRSSLSGRVRGRNLRGELLFSSQGSLRVAQRV